MPREVAEVALEAHRAGLSVCPPREDGTKAPEGSWKRWTEERADESQVSRWYADGRVGLGVVCGQVSGGLECLELEGRAVADGLHSQLRELADEAGLGDVLTRVLRGYTERTPSGGLHVLYRVPTPKGNTKLASRPGEGETVEVLIETRGEGGYVITAPTNGSVHPTGEAWTLEAGGFANLASITDEERDELWRVARLLDQMPQRPSPAPAPSRDEDRPGDRYNDHPQAQARTLALLERHGWQRVFSRRKTDYLRRPGKDDRGISATLGHVAPGVLYVFSTSTTFEADRAYDPFAVLAHLEHGGDFGAAARALAEPDFRERRGLPESRVRPGQPPDGLDAEAGLVFRSAASVEMRRQRFLYVGVVPLGALTLFVGYPNIGKSTMAAWLAAGVSRGDLPGDLDGPGGVLFMSGEDAWDTGIRPRLVASGADLNRVGWVERPDGEDPTFPRDVEALEQFVVDNGIALVVLDTVIDYADETMTSDNSNLQTRRMLKPFKMLAERTGISVLALGHPNKGSGRGIDRVAASRAWGAHPRAVFALGEDPEDPDLAVMACQKLNAGAKPTPQRYRVAVKRVGTDDGAIEGSTIEWLGEAPGVDVEDLYGPLDRAEKSKRDEAKDFLRASGVMDTARPARELLQAAEAELGVGKTTLHEARRELGVKSWTDGFQGPAYWGPRAEDRANDSGGIPPQSESLERPGGTGSQSPNDSLPETLEPLDGWEPL